MIGDHLITTLGWHQVAAMAGVALLAAAMTAQPIAPTLATAASAAKSLLAGPLTEGRLGRITRAAALLFLQLGDSGGQAFQLRGEVLNQRSHAGRNRVPVTPGNPSG